MDRVDPGSAGGAREAGRAAAWRRAAMAGVALCTMLLVAAAAGVLLGVTSPSARLYTFDVVAAITFTVLGGVVAPRQPGNPVGGLFVGIALASSVVVVSASYGDYGPMTWLNQWSPPVAYGLIPLVLLVFPDGRLPSARWRPVAYAAVGGTCLAAAGLAVAAWDVPGLLADLDAARTPLALAALRVARVGLIVVVISLVAAIASLVVRFRHSSGDTRQQLKWLAVGRACIPVVVAMDILGLAYVSDVLGAAAIPVASTAAILKYRLYDIDLFINRSLVYAILTLLVVGAYVAIVATSSTASRIGRMGTAGCRRGSSGTGAPAAARADPAPGESAPGRRPRRSLRRAQPSRPEPGAGGRPGNGALGCRRGRDRGAPGALRRHRADQPSGRSPGGQPRPRRRHRNRAVPDELPGPGGGYVAGEPPVVSSAVLGRRAQAPRRSRPPGRPRRPCRAPGQGPPTVPRPRLVRSREEERRRLRR